MEKQNLQKEKDEDGERAFRFSHEQFMRLKFVSTEHNHIQVCFSSVRAEVEIQLFVSKTSCQVFLDSADIFLIKTIGIVKETWTTCTNSN